MNWAPPKYIAEKVIYGNSGQTGSCLVNCRRRMHVCTHMMLETTRLHRFDPPPTHWITKLTKREDTTDALENTTCGLKVPQTSEASINQTPQAIGTDCEPFCHPQQAVKDAAPIKCATKRKRDVLSLHMYACGHCGDKKVVNLTFSVGLTHCAEGFHVNGIRQQAYPAALNARRV